MKNENYDHLYGEYNQDNNEFSIIDSWIQTEEFSQMCESAERGDQTCIDFLEEFNSKIDSLMFHIQNQSSPERLGYEFAQIEKYIDTIF